MLDWSGYHVTSRGDRREFADDSDRLGFLDIVAQALSRFDGQMLAYCLMGNHYHFVLRTRQADLSLLMRHINGVYTQSVNAATERLATCSRAASRPSWWTGTPTCWKCAGT
jgi:REP element-mobilizing transposase RayT